jgi:multidrug efflux pump subunit AcrA (membrane-fusion protein)
VIVKAHGTVVPSRAAVLSPEVNGRVTWIADDLLPGGRFEKGAIMLRLDGRDYKLALEAQAAAVQQARTQLELEERRKKIAKREWEIMGKEGDPLTLSEKQVKTAEVAVAAARSNVQRARLNVGRTVLKAPFNAIIQERNVDVGQIIGPASPVVTIAGTDEFWVKISVPVERLVWLDIPGVNVDDPAKASRAVVWRELNGRRVERSGRIVRLLGDVDPMGRMARLLVAIEDPLGINDPAPVPTAEAPASLPNLPLLLGSFVQVDLQGRSVDGVVELPRQALRDGDSVYVMRGERVEVPDWYRDMLIWTDGDELDQLLTVDRLKVVDVDVVWRQLDTVYVHGLADGDQIITSPVPSPIDGMKVRTPDRELADGATAAAGAGGAR